MKTLSILFCAALYGIISVHAQPCLPNGITFTTQGQIDSFFINYSGCTEIEGDVTIGDYYYSDTLITNLDGLASLTTIGGNLSISYNDALPNVDGLSNLTTIGGNLSIYSNDALPNVDGLSHLTSLGGAIHK